MPASKHKLHDMLEAHIREWAQDFGVTFDKHEIDEALRVGHVQKSLDEAVAGKQDPRRLREALAFTGGMADFMAMHGATDPLVGATVAAIRDLLNS